MFEKLLIGLGLITIPFYSIPGDTRSPKMMLALGIALTLSLWVFFKGKLKPVSNIWLYILIGYLFLSIQLAPKIGFSFLKVSSPNFWVWQVFFTILIFFLTLISIRSLNLSEYEIQPLLKIIAWVTFAMSSYAILQYFGIEQFYLLKNIPISSQPSSAAMTGALGRSNLLACFLALNVPIILYLRKYLFLIVVLTAIILTRSHLAIGGVAISLLFLWALENKKRLILTVITFVSVLIVFCAWGVNNNKLKGYIDTAASGRIQIWRNVVTDINSPLAKDAPVKFPITGLGLGSFKYFYNVKHNSNVDHADNEYLQFTYEAGIVGLVLLLGALFLFLKNILKEIANRYKRYLLASFICSALCAGGELMWQLGPTVYYTVFILGLLITPIEQKGESV